MLQGHRHGAAHRVRDQHLLDLVLQFRAAAAADGRAQRPVVTVKPEKRRRSWSPQQVQVAPSGLALPVVGVKPDQLTDTFDAGARRRAGVMTPSTSWPPKGTPVIAAADGTIEKLFNSVRGGITDLRALARPEVDLLLRPPVGLRAGPRRRPAGQARPGDRPRRPYRRCQRRRARTSISRSIRWRRASAGGTGTAINPYPLLAGKKASG